MWFILHLKKKFLKAKLKCASERGTKTCQFGFSQSSKNRFGGFLRHRLCATQHNAAPEHCSVLHWHSLSNPPPPTHPTHTGQAAAMPVAGYLVLNNVRAAYVEIHTGVLICTPRLHKSKPAPRSRPTLSASPSCVTNDGDNKDAVFDISRLSISSTVSTATTLSSSDVGDELLAKEERNDALPLLALRRMEKQRDVTTYKKTTTSEEVYEYVDSDEEDDEPVPEDMPATTAGGRERVVQLSGHIVEVIEKETEFDTSSYPFSFQVNTYNPAKRDADGNKIGQSELVDSLILSAMDESAKTLWVKRIKHWNRFGWRDTEFVHADDNDFFYLQAMMLSSEKRYSSYHAYPSRRASIASSSFDDSRASEGTFVPSGRPSRRRFYRAQVGFTALVPSN